MPKFTVVAASASTETEVTPRKVLLTVEEAAELMSLPRTAMCKLILTGEIASVKIGRLRRVPYLALEQWIQRQLAA
jgi:excisionase family DNA binding protein